MDFSDELFTSVCTEVANGESLSAVCRRKDMPSRSGFYGWVAADETGELADRYARAMQYRADVLFEDFIDLADETTPENANAMRVRLDARKWAMGKMRPKKYGDKMEVEQHVFNVTIAAEDGDL